MIILQTIIRMTKQDGLNILLTKLFLFVGSATGLTVNFWQEADLVLGVILKFVSIISFIIVIMLNLPKLRRKIKIWLSVKARK